MSYIGQNPVFGDFPYQTLIGDGTASYTLNFNVSNENGLLVFLNGAIQVPGENYTAGGTSLQFADNVPVGTQIFAYGMGLPKSMLSTSAGAIGLNELAAGVYANEVEVRNFINDTKMITPKTLADAFMGVNQSLTTNGYQKFPGGLMLQWMEVSISNTTPSQIYTLPTTFFAPIGDRNSLTLAAHFNTTPNGTDPFLVSSFGASLSSVRVTKNNTGIGTASGSVIIYALGRWK